VSFTANRALLMHSGSIMIRDGSSGRTAWRAPTTATLVAVAGVLALAGCSSTPAGAAGTSTTWSVGTPRTTDKTLGPHDPSGTWTGGTSTARPAPPPSVGPTAPDGVPSAVATLPPTDRVQQVPGGTTRVSGADGAWVISRPAAVSRGYAEVLHLDASGRILRAYPFAGVPPQWLLLTPQAVYCGRRGDEAAPDAMVCRIDRTTGAVRVLVSAGGAGGTALTQGDVAARPGTWRVDDRAFAADLGVPPSVGTEVTFSGGGTLRLSVDTLAVLGS